ncbi:MAG: hypothetical protein JWO50_129 [Candidatus Kaiserbacteria bacterium]|nr:hypothetical protein [Candidatus Kaiserbacteria bacterium]
MNDFTQMHVFFFITTLVVIVIGILTSLILWRFWIMLGHIEKLSRDISEEGTLVRADIAHMRNTMLVEGFKMGLLSNLLSKTAKRFTTRRRPKKETPNEESSTAE